MWPFKPSLTIELAEQMTANAVEKALEMAANGSDTNFRTRMSQASGGYDFADTLHNIFWDFGYPITLDFFNYWNMFRRFGIAKNIVKVVPNIGWSTPPIIEGDERFNNELETLNDRLNLWVRLRGLDTRQRVGRYGGMFMRMRDSKRPDEPLEMVPGEAALVDMMPLYESQLTVSTTDQDPQSETFGMPTMYEFNAGAVGNRNEDNNSSFQIHPSRIVIASEDSDNNGIYGISVLEAPYNSLLDLRKIIGAGGEGFYKNAAQNIIFELTDAKSMSGKPELVAKLGEAFDDFNQNRMRRGFVSPGFKAHTLQSDLIQPKEFFMDALNDVAAASEIPATIIIGQQTGRLASDKDNQSLLGSIQSRRIGFQTELTRNILDWMIEHGVLPASDYEVEWDDLLAMSKSEKLGNGKTMADTNRLQFQAGQQPAYSEEEIREEGGLDPEDVPDELPEEDDEAGLIQDPEEDAA